MDLSAKYCTEPLASETQSSIEHSMTNWSNSEKIPIVLNAIARTPVCVAMCEDKCRVIVRDFSIQFQVCACVL